MARRNGQATVAGELKVICLEQEALIGSLRKQIELLEGERDAARHAFEVVTGALRRSGCCE
jgi:uncharacterized membrane-anchored protein